MIMAQKKILSLELEGNTEAIGKMKNNKAPGGDRILENLLKKGSESLQKELYGLFLSILYEEKISNQWKKRVLCPLYKKDNVLNCQNYLRRMLLQYIHDQLLLHPYALH